MIFAKCPIPGKSKTRLIPLLGEEGSVRLAKAMLSDVLKTIDGCPELNAVRKILVYAPGTSEGRERMEAILDELGLKTGTDSVSSSSSNNKDSLDVWHLLPMMSKSNDLRSNDLGSKLEDALVRVRNLEGGPSPHGVVFLGMDAPILPLDDIVGGLKHAASSSKKEEEEDSHPTPSATLGPARDGGYAMLCLPHTADPARTFRNLYWSHPWTGMSQTKALTDQGIFVRIGRIVRDIDEASDVEELCRHLGIERKSPQQATTNEVNDEQMKKNLEFPGSWSPIGFDGDGSTDTNSERIAITSSHPTCHFTRKALVCALDATQNAS